MNNTKKHLKTEYSYGQFSLDHLKASAKGVELYNGKMFWECHEELEDHWLDDRGDDARYVYWTIIQVATSLYHLGNENLAGARGMIQKSQDKVLQCEKRKVLTDLVYRFLSWKRFTKLVMEINAKEASPEDFELLYKFRFSKPSKWDLDSEKTL